MRPEDARLVMAVTRVDTRPAAPMSSACATRQPCHEVIAPLVSSEKPIKAYEECMRCSGSTAKLTAGAEARTQYRRPACALGSRHLARRASGEASGQKQRTNKRRDPQAHTSAFASRRGTHDECIVPTHSRPCRSHLPSLKRMPGPPGARGVEQDSLSDGASGLALHGWALKARIRAREGARGASRRARTVLLWHGSDGQAHDARVCVHRHNVLLQACQQVASGARHDGTHQRRQHHRQARHLLHRGLKG